MRKSKGGGAGSIRQAEESARPSVRTVKTEDSFAAIRCGLAEAKASRGREVDDLFDELERRPGG
jgi:hypothetical protein